MNENTRQVLVVFNSGPVIYGLERAVLETFDLLRPEVQSHFLVSYHSQLLNSPTFEEIKRRGFSVSFFSDRAGWPRIGWPRSIKHLYQLPLSVIRGNIDVLKAAQGKDVLYVPGINYLYYALLAAIWYRLRQRRVIYHFHNLLTAPSFLLRLVSLVVTDFVHNTSYGLNAVKNANPFIRKKRNWIIPFAILPRQSSENGNGHFNKDALNILFVGQVAQHKGVGLLLDAFSLLNKSNENLTLHIVGGCDNPDLAKRIATADQTGSSIKYWGYRDDVLEMMKMADVLVPPSPSATNESFGRVIVEAMSVGVPAVCFRSGAYQEIVIHEQTGLLCEEETAECLAQNIQRLIADVNLRAKCGELALRTYEQLYSVGRVRWLWRQLFEVAR